MVTGEQAIRMMRAAVDRTLFLAQRISENDYLWNPLLQVIGGDLTLPGVAIVELVRGYLDLGNSFLVDEFGWLGRAEFFQGFSASSGTALFVLNHDKRFFWDDDPLGVGTYGQPQEDWYLDFLQWVRLSQSSKRIKMSDALITGVRTLTEQVRL